MGDQEKTYDWAWLSPIYMVTWKRKRGRGYLGVDERYGKVFEGASKNWNGSVAAARSRANVTVTPVVRVCGKADCLCAPADLQVPAFIPTFIMGTFNAITIKQYLITLPAELICRILEYADYKTLVACAGVTPYYLLIPYKNLLITDRTGASDTQRKNKIIFYTAISYWSGGYRYGSWS